VPPRAVIVDHGRDHHLVCLGRLDQRIEPCAHGCGGAGEDARAVSADALAVGRCVRIGGRRTAGPPLFAAAPAKATGEIGIIVTRRRHASGFARH